MLLSFEVSFFYFYQFPLDNKDGSLELSLKKSLGGVGGGLRKSSGTNTLCFEFSK